MNYEINIRNYKYEIYVGDCFKYLPKIKLGIIDLIIADLPYGKTACKWDIPLPLDDLWSEYKRILKSNGIVILTATQPYASVLVNSNISWFKNEIIWEKNRGTNPMSAKYIPLSVHENILIFSNPKSKNKTYNPQMTIGKPYKGFNDKDNKMFRDRSKIVGMEMPEDKSKIKTLGEIYGSKTKSIHKENSGTRFPISIQQFSSCNESSHPTRKPVEMIQWLIRTYSNPNELILDNVIGSGATLIAAYHEKRNFIGMEKEKQYVDESLMRLKRASGFENEKLINLVFKE